MGRVCCCRARQWFGRRSGRVHPAGSVSLETKTLTTEGQQGICFVLYLCYIGFAELGDLWNIHSPAGLFHIVKIVINTSLKACAANDLSSNPRCLLCPPPLIFHPTSEVQEFRLIERVVITPPTGIVLLNLVLALILLWIGTMSLRLRDFPHLIAGRPQPHFMPK